MRVSLVVPNVSRHLHAETFEPLGVLYLAAVVRAHHDVQVVDAFNRDLGLEEALAEVLAFRPDVVGLSITMSPTAPFGRALARRLKQLDPRTRVVAGGTHATFSADSLASNPDFDAVVLHDGEETFAELLAAAERGDRLDQVPGLVLAADGKTRRTAERRLPADLDALPFPARDLLSHDDLYQRRHVLSSRGCVFKCIYCAAAAMNAHRWRKRSAGNVLDEVAALAERHTRRFYFADDNFTVSRKRVLELCAAIPARGLDVRWSCLSRVEFIRDPGLLRAMAAAGCDQIFVGVESGSDRVLERMQRRYTADDVARVVDQCRDAGIDVTASFIVGNPFETAEDVRASFALARRLNTPNIAFHIFTPYVGTEAFTTPAAFDLEIAGDPEAFDKNREPVSRTRHLPRDEIMSLYCESFGISLQKARQRLWAEV